MENKIVVDARGEQCPIPVVRAKKALSALKGEGVITVLVDNEIAVQNLTKMANYEQKEVSSRKLEENSFEVVILSKEENGQKAVQETEEQSTPEVSCIPDRRGSTVIAVDANVMGRGNDELGKVLIKGFIYAVTQLEELPETMLFYNGGAELTTEGSDSLEDLKSLEAQGVVIKTCGTCLNYYGLSDKLRVGEVTNMYDIVETLQKASKVIKP